MQYAPVVIPTLNRIKHFRECIESLNECNWAEKTDVYVALDYPPSKKYMSGYQEICIYLDQAQFHFNSLRVIRRERNYGLGPNGNLNTLLNDEIWTCYDRVIISEDDNVFAKTFLQFIDYGLEKCENRKEILRIGGFAIPAKWKEDGRELVLLNSNANTWGYGTWRDRAEKISKIDTLGMYHDILSSTERKKHILSGSKNDDGALAWYVMMGNTAKNDTFVSIYIRDQNMFCLFPKISKVINNGADGSGQNSGKKDMYGMNSVKMDEREEFDATIFDEIPPYYDETMEAVNEVYHIPRWKMLWISFVFSTHDFWKKNNKLGKWIRKIYIKLNPRL